MIYEPDNCSTSRAGQPTVRRRKSRRTSQSSLTPTNGENGAEQSQVEGVRRSARLSVQGPLGNFSKLPPEVFSLILNYISVRDAANLGQTSKTIRDFLILRLKSNQFKKRLVRPMITNTSGFLFDQPHMKPIPNEIQLVWMDIGVLLKKLTTVIPTQQRIFMYQSLTYELKHFLVKKRPDYNDLVFSHMMGVILQVLIAGWDEQECNRVYCMITQWLNMKKTLTVFLSNPLATYKSGEVLLARNLKCLFLDSCSDFDRAMWTNIIFNSCHVCEMPTGKDQAKLILLLTAPIRAQGGICWDFYEDGDDVSSHIEAYMSAASILERLARLELNRNNSTKVDTLQILATLFCTPSSWPIRSVAALLLSLHCLSSPLVAKYFKLLRKSGLSYVIKDILTEVMFVSTLFSIFDFRISAHTVKSLILLGLECGWLPDEKKGIVLSICRELGEMSESLLDDAVLAGDFPEQVYAFVNTYKEMCFQMDFVL